MADALTVVSADGTALHVEVHGDAGPALLLVHGSTATAARWRPVLAALSARHRVYALNRRGRAGSGDGPQYAIDQEVQDVQAVIAALPGERLVLVGHSYGAICALEAALREPRVQALSLYEPPLRDAASDEDMTAIAQARDALAAGRPEDALLLFYRLVLKLPEVAIDGLRAQANWTQRVQIAHTVVREIAAVQHYRAPWPALSRLNIPVQLFLGELSLPRFAQATRQLADALPDVQTEVLTGQAHNGIDGDPAAYANALLAFIDTPQDGVRKPDLTDPRFAALYDRPGFLIRRLHQVCNEMFGSACRSLDLTPNQYSVLFLLDRCEVLDIAGIGRLADLDRTTTALVVKILAERRLIEKRRSKIDQRKYDVKLTVAGRRHLEEAAALSQASVEQLLDAYTEQERESLMMLLRKGVRHFSRML